MTDTSRDSVLPVGELIVSSDFIAKETIINTAADRFFANRDLEALVVIEDRIPLGLITRTKLLLTLSRRFGYELYGRHPVSIIANDRPLIVNEHELLDSVITKAFSRPAGDIYDEIIVVSEGTYLGLLSVKNLILQQSSALTRSMLLEELASTRASELEQISQLKSQFMANVTHELRSPVNAIIGLAELLKMAVADGSMELVKERLALMLTCSNNLKATITNILDLSKIEAGKMDVTLQEINIVEILQQVAETTRILLGDKPVSVTLSLPADTVTFSTDPIKLRQILTNLTSNAAKFTNTGSIDISLEMIVNGIEIQVRDTGIGVKEDDLQHIFTAFGQAEDATTKTHEGTGLGLTISNNLVKLIGGSISVESTYGEGSVFFLTIQNAPQNIKE